MNPESDITDALDVLLREYTLATVACEFREKNYPISEGDLHDSFNDTLPAIVRMYRSKIPITVLRGHAVHSVYYQCMGTIPRGISGAAPEEISAAVDVRTDMLRNADFARLKEFVHLQVSRLHIEVSGVFFAHALEGHSFAFIAGRLNMTISSARAKYISACLQIRADPYYQELCCSSSAGAEDD